MTISSSEQCKRNFDLFWEVVLLPFFMEFLRGMMHIRSIEDKNKYIKIDETNIDKIEDFYDNNRDDSQYLSPMTIKIQRIWDLPTNEIQIFIKSQIEKRAAALNFERYELSHYTIEFYSNIIVIIYRYETRKEFVNRMLTCYRAKQRRLERRLVCNAKARYLHSIQHK